VVCRCLIWPHHNIFPNLTHTPLISLCQLHGPAAILSTLCLSMLCHQAAKYWWGYLQWPTISHSCQLQAAVRTWTSGTSSKANIAAQAKSAMTGQISEDEGEAETGLRRQIVTIRSQAIPNAKSHLLTSNLTIGSTSPTPPGLTD